MPVITAAVLLLAVFVTAFLSGIFGMAGGLILMGVLLALFSVPQAMVAHGLLQMVANGWRSWLWRSHIDHKILGLYCLGALIAIGLLLLIAYRPSRIVVMVLLGLVPLTVWLPKKNFHLNAERPFHAVFCGIFVTGLNTFAGVAGPALDIFFVNTNMGRHAIVATKSITQVIAHLVKVLFWSGAVLGAALLQSGDMALLLLIAVPVSMTGTWVGGFVLNRLSDRHFLRWVKALVSVIGLIYLARAGIVFTQA